MNETRSPDMLLRSRSTRARAATRRAPTTGRSATGKRVRGNASSTVQPAQLSNLAGQLTCTTGRAYVNHAAQTVTVEIPRERPIVAIRIDMREPGPTFRLGLRRARDGSPHLDAYADLSSERAYRWQPLRSATSLQPDVAAALVRAVARVNDWWKGIDAGPPPPARNASSSQVKLEEPTAESAQDSAPLRRWRHELVAATGRGALQ